MKYIIIFLIANFGFSLSAQTIKNLFFDFGINHSGFIKQTTNNKVQNDFKENFYPNPSFAIGIEIKIKHKISLLSGLALRKTGTKYLIPVTSIQYPDGNGEFRSVYDHIKQVSSPLLFCYSFGNKYKIKPLLGITNNFIYKAYTIFPNSTKQYEIKDINKYYINGAVGFTLTSEKLMSSRFGLGLKFTYEKSLQNMSTNSNYKLNQAVLYGGIILNYNFKQQNI